MMSRSGASRRRSSASYELSSRAWRSALSMRSLRTTSVDMPHRDVAERVSQKCLSDTDRADDGEVQVGFDEAQCGKLGQQLTVIENCRGIVPRFHLHGGVEVGAVGAEPNGVALPA